MIEREIAPKLLSLAKQFPVVSLTGPRQSGKSTLLRTLFSNYSYASLENEDTRAFAHTDPRGFLAHIGSHAIIDEAQRAPSLFSYIQGIVDEAGTPGQFIISGSQNFLLMDAIDQSLAGRAAVVNLLPFSARELTHAGHLPASINGWLFTGSYPRIYDVGIEPADFYPSYIQTYLERDVRSLGEVSKIADFERFLTLLAINSGQTLNLQGLSRTSGISVNTIKNWLSILEASFLVHRLVPHHANLGKRLIKSPKIYLRDTGITSSLVGLEQAEEISLSTHKGALFETAVIEEIAKAYHNRGRRPKLTYWRDSAGREIDILVERGMQVQWAIEVKSSATYSPSFFKHLDTLGPDLGVDPRRRVVVYTGAETFETSHGLVCSFADFLGLPL